MEGGIKTFFENDSIPVPAFCIKLFYSLSGYVIFIFILFVGVCFFFFCEAFVEYIHKNTLRWL